MSQNEFGQPQFILGAFALDGALAESGSKAGGGGGSMIFPKISGLPEVAPEDSKPLGLSHFRQIL